MTTLKTTILHPELGLPYGRNIVIGKQARAGAAWKYSLPPDRMQIVEKAARHGSAMLFLRRDPDDNLAWERILYLRLPPAVLQKR